MYVCSLHCTIVDELTIRAVRYHWDGPGRLLIRHDKEPGAVYVLPIKAEGSTPMPVTPLIKPSVVYNQDYKSYQRLRIGQKKNPGGFGHRHGHRGKSRKKKEREISESAERRTHNPKATTESPQHTPASTPKDNPFPLSGDSPLLCLSSPLLSIAWSNRGEFHDLSRALLLTRTA